MALLEQVFGVSASQVLSYVERPDVDNRFLDALISDKEVVVYGSSKQGKTALVSKYLPYSEHLLVSLTPRMNVRDIYQSILSKAGIKIHIGGTERRATETEVGVATRVKAMIPLFGGGEVEGGRKVTTGSGKDTQYEEVPINLELPQHVADLLRQVKSEKWVILENFHYLGNV
ncbi:hypothetical protein [Reyranella sp.]|uniref:hypothetical protein n=1 Tax=Reyranella sp. TaxID=1929291 RepID=UPI003D0AB6CE